jgi:hypothetical protein
MSKTESKKTNFEPVLRLFKYIFLIHIPILDLESIQEHFLRNKILCMHTVNG